MTDTLAERLEGIATDNRDTINPIALALLREAAARIRELEAWQPIETAPRDGTEVLVMIRPKVIRLGWYFKPSSRSEGWRDESGKLIKPTHWRPLPAPPEPNTPAQAGDKG